MENVGGQNCNNPTHLPLGTIWKFGTSLWGPTAGGSGSAADTNFSRTTQPTAVSPALTTPNAAAPLMDRRHQRSSFRDDVQTNRLLYSGGVGYHSRLCSDPHLTCLRLGKRHYLDDDGGRLAGLFADPDKRVRPSCDFEGIVVGGLSPLPPEEEEEEEAAVTLEYAPVAVPRCQVEGCHVALVTAKEYHRRHRVCETHSKAPKATVHGIEQRFCQQCSRFHAVTEFDDSKRSCRRRLAGHNERRRKISHDSFPSNPSQDNKLMMTGRYPYPYVSTRAFSLLSSKTDSWVYEADLSSRSSAALQELIAESRAAAAAVIAGRQVAVDQDEENWGCHQNHRAVGDLASAGAHPSQFLTGPTDDWDQFRAAAAGPHVTLDLMQTPGSAFGLWSLRGKSSKGEASEGCSRDRKSVV